MNPTTKRITPKEIHRILNRHNYFTNSHYLSNIIIVRNNHSEAFSFNDTLFIFCDEVFKSTHHSYNVTANPSLFKLNTLNPLRNLIIKEGQYINAFQFGKNNRQKILIQKESITLISSINQNDERTGHFKITIRSADPHKDPYSPKDWSPGSIIFEDPIDFRHFISLCQVASRFNAGIFSLTIINLSEFYPLG